MLSPRALLFIYDELTPEERARVEAYLEKHPGEQRLIEEGRRLRNLIGEVTSVELSDECLAEVIVSRAASGGTATGALQFIAQRVDEARTTDPEVARRYEEMEARLEEIEASLPSPSEHFIRLLGEAEADGSVQRAHRRAQSRASDRPPRSMRRRVRATTLTVATLVIAVVALLFVAEAMHPEYVQLAALDAAPAAYDQPRLRGPEPSASPDVLHFREGLESVIDARRTTLGLFPRYDESGLREALAHLEATAAETTDLELATAARVVMSRIHLHLGELSSARELLEIAIGGEGPAALEARELLEAIEELNRTR